MTKLENEVRKRRFIQTEIELLRRAPSSGMSENHQKQVKNGQGQFIQAQREYLQRIRDQYELYNEVELCLREKSVCAILAFSIRFDSDNLGGKRSFGARVQGHDDVGDVDPGPQRRARREAPGGRRVIICHNGY